jgi:flagellar assembly factor FliW
VSESNRCKIVLETRRWGKLEVDLNEVIAFPKGIPGFEAFKRYALFTSEEIQPFQWLICIDEPDLGFVVVPPEAFYPDYNPKLFEADLKELQTDPDDKLALLAIVTLARNPVESTANLQGPLLINLTKKIGKQVVVADDRYSVKHPIVRPQGAKREKKEVQAKV